MIILGIETSCDETAISAIDASGTLERPDIKVLANVTLSQAKIHAKHGGVFPSLAKREHTKNLLPILEEVLRQSDLLKTQERKLLPENVSAQIAKILEREQELADALLKVLPTTGKPNIDLIAVTVGPGLEPALWTGINFAKALGLAWGISVAAVNHMEGHIASVLAKTDELKNQKSPKQNRFAAEQAKIKIKFPLLALLISGGHTELVLAEEWGQYKILGATRDDAVGEVFDKVGRMLGLPYPAGPEISRLAKQDRLERKIADKYNLPRPMIKSGNLDFSFSGLKTAVLYKLKKVPKLTDSARREIAREFEDAVTETLIYKTKMAVETFLPATIIVAGGVSANVNIRKHMQDICDNLGVSLLVPDIALSTDNALMIALAGFVQTQTGKSPTSGLSAAGNIKVSQN